MPDQTSLLTAFHGPRQIAQGPRAEVAKALHAGGFGPQHGGVLIFDDAGRGADLDLSGTAQDVAQRYDAPPQRGRPKLGVTAREVTLLPRHWDWLATQRGGASATLRRLIDAARKAEMAQGIPRDRLDAVYRFCSAIGGDLPGFEEAMRVLYQGDPAAFFAAISAWPKDIAAHAQHLGQAT